LHSTFWRGNWKGKCPDAKFGWGSSEKGRWRWGGGEKSQKGMGQEQICVKKNRWGDPVLTLSLGEKYWLGRGRRSGLSAMGPVLTTFGSKKGRSK